MSKLKICIFNIIIIFILISCNYSASEDKPEIDNKENIANYKKMLLKYPDNCFYLEQIACSYQFLNDYSNAVDFYKKTIDKCPNRPINKFQLGICYYLIMDRNNGIKYMNEAIRDAETDNNTAVAEMFKREKKLWLEKWDSVKKLEWNKKGSNLE
ncbi:MAG: hypothetical protein GY749_31370 [Desulfobacteraceae bacterium]|nr:hypothetical protein [Desulfobacteraceae bacterium]